VGGDFGAVGFAELGDLANFRYAAAVDDIGLDDLSATGVEELFELEAGDEAFAAGDGDGALRRDFAEGLWHFAPEGFFDEHGLEGGDGAGEFQGGANRESLPHFQADFHVRAAAFAGGFHFGGQAVEAFLFGAAFGQHPLDAGPAFGAGLLCECLDFGGRAIVERLAPVAVIGAERAGFGGAQEPPDGLAELFTEDVPEGYIDGR
jgi:hypothetical protein